MELNWQHIPAHQRRISGFLLVAVILHSLVLFGLHASGYAVKPQLPDWMNIKLVAGIDESADEKIVLNTAKPVNKPRPVVNRQAKTEQPADEAVETSQQQAQHFVKADSHPFEQQNPKPFYPAAARKRGMQGQVLLQVEVNTKGKVSNIALKRSSGYRLLDDAALATVKEWRFIPAKNNNKLVVSVVEVPVRFELTAF